MEVILNSEIKNKEDTIVALGNFDGIHVGHQALIKTAVLKGKELNLKPSVFTFVEHTSDLLHNNSNNYLMTNKDRTKILDEFGIELLYLIKFNDYIRNMSPEDFIKKILIDNLNAKVVVVGFNFRFGYKASGDIETLKAYGKTYNFSVVVIDPVILEDNIVSTTLIKMLLSRGRVKSANSLLTRPYSIEGVVVNGKGLGKKLGFATANISLDFNYTLPKLGVYKTETIVDGEKYLSVTSVGYNPTFNEKNINIETHIFEFDKDIYTKRIKIIFLDFIREEMKFNTKDELIKQIEQDISIVKNT